MVAIERPVKLPLLAFGQPDSGFLTARVTQPFSAAHPALDIGNERSGDIVVSSAAGVVIGSGRLHYPWSTPDGRTTTGNTGGEMIAIDHGSGVHTVYAHLESRFVGVGARVAAGTAIGTIGNTGYSFGAHLHYALIVATRAQLDALRNARQTIPFELCRNPWPFPMQIGSDLVYTYKAGIYEDWRTVTGRPFYTLAGAEKRWTDPVEVVSSVCEVNMEDGTDARLIPYGTEMLIVPRASLVPVKGTRVDPAAARSWIGEVGSWFR